MGLFDDILKGLPANAVLREQITQLNAQKAAAETENAILKDDLRQAKAEIAELNKQVEKFTHTENVDEMELEFLKAISAHDELDDEEIAALLKLNLQRVRYHLQRLQDIGHVTQSAVTRIGQPFPYCLTHKGRGFLIDKELL